MTYDDDDDDIQEAVLDTEPVPQAAPDPTPAPTPTPSPAPTTPTPTPSDDDDDDDDEEEYNTFMDDLFEKFTLGPIPGKIAFGGLITIIVVILLLAALTVPGFGFYKGGKVRISPSLYEYSTSANEDIEFTVWLSQPTMGRIDKSDGSYRILYDGDEAHKGSISFSDTAEGVKGEVTIEERDVFVDNGEYTIEVSAAGKTVTDVVTMIRTVKHVEPEAYIQYDVGDDGQTESGDAEDDLMFIQLGFYDADEDGNVVFTMGNGEAEILYCESSPDCSTPEVVDTIIYDVDMGNLDWYLEEAGTSGKVIISLERKDWDGNDDDSDGGGYYAIDMTFTNSFSKSDDADEGEKTGLSRWIPDERD